MNKEQFTNQWNNVKAQIRQKWNKLTEDDISDIEGDREQLVSYLQKRYGYNQNQAEQELANWERELEAKQAAQTRR